MAIPTQQLETWSHQQATASAEAAYTSVRNALATQNSPLSGKNYDVYLQGSYRSNTNVRSDSDVDVVVQFNTSFGHDLSALDANQLQQFNATFPPATYLWGHFRSDVLTTLRSHYGAGVVQDRDKCLQVAAAPGRLTVDVIPAIQFRNYEYFYGQGQQSFIEGIRFHDKNNRTIVNYPKLHYSNGVLKNASTAGIFKPSVRLFKNARSYAVDHGLLAADVASSYFVDCLIWNVPDQHFATVLDDTYCNVVNYLQTANLSGFYCRNGIVPLFGATPEQWDEAQAAQLITVLAQLWNGW
jgi:hypothetical protein